MEAGDWVELLPWWGVEGPKTSEKSKSGEEAEAEGGVMVNFLRLADKRV